MIREDSRQRQLTGFMPGFGKALNPENRWIKLSESIPWSSLCAAYDKTMNPGQGRPSKPARVVIGAMIIKHKNNLSDEETVEQIRENPYMQYLLGFTEFQDKQALAPSLFVDIRKRMGLSVFREFETAVHASISPKKTKEKVSHKGKIRLDATVIEQGIKYPTDIDLLNRSREICEKIIDVLYKELSLANKPRTYRKRARKEYLGFAKLRKKTQKRRRAAIKAQLQYLRRDIGHVEWMLGQVEGTAIPLEYKLLRQYWIIQHVFVQQLQMHTDKVKRCDDRIVSISQPHIRPMVRGKAKKATEFGSKINVSLDDQGIATIDRQSFDAFNESQDLQKQVLAYKDRMGHWPEVVLADQIYGTHKNRKWLKEQGIRFGGKALGRPPKDPEKNKQRKKQAAQDATDRIPIEGKFGQAKRSYSLGRVEAKLPETTIAWIGLSFLVMNLVKSARFLLRLFQDTLFNNTQIKYNRNPEQLSSNFNCIAWIQAAVRVTF